MVCCAQPCRKLEHGYIVFFCSLFVIFVAFLVWHAVEHCTLFAPQPPPMLCMIARMSCKVSALKNTKEITPYIHTLLLPHGSASQCVRVARAFQLQASSGLSWASSVPYEKGASCCVVSDPGLILQVLDFKDRFDIFQKPQISSQQATLASVEIALCSTSKHRNSYKPSWHSGLQKWADRPGWMRCFALIRPVFGSLTFCGCIHGSVRHVVSICFSTVSLSLHCLQPVLPRSACLRSMPVFSRDQSKKCETKIHLLCFYWNQPPKKRMKTKIRAPFFNCRQTWQTWNQHIGNMFFTLLQGLIKSGEQRFKREKPPRGSVTALHGAQGCFKKKTVSYVPTKGHVTREKNSVSCTKVACPPVNSHASQIVTLLCCS